MQPSPATYHAKKVTRKLTTPHADTPQWQLVARPHGDDKTQAMYEVLNKIVYLNFHEGQIDTWNSTARFTYMLAGSQGGKTSFGAWWLAREIMTQGRGDYLAVTATYDLFGIKMLPEILKVFVEILGLSDDAHYYKQRKIMEIKNPITGKFEGGNPDSPNCYGRLILRSADAEGGLESATAKAAWADECGQKNFDKLTWDAIDSRIALMQGRLLGTTSLYNHGELKKRAKNSDDTNVIQFESRINPTFSDAEFERLRNTMSSHRFIMRYGGKFAKPAGHIFEDFIEDYHERGGHLCKWFAIPREWMRVVAVDPGIVNQFIGWYAFHPEWGKWIKYHEQKVPRKNQDEHAKDAKAKADADGVRVSKWAIGAVSEKYIREDWLRVVKTDVVQPPSNDVEHRIDTVIGMLKRREIVFLESCHETIEQMLSYSRELDKADEPTDKIQDKTKFHAVDETGYFALAVSKPLKRQNVDARLSHYA